MINSINDVPTLVMACEFLKNNNLITDEGIAKLFSAYGFPINPYYAGGDPLEDYSKARALDGLFSKFKPS